jgi:methylthioribose-1-phosphate isomerase
VADPTASAATEPGPDQSPAPTPAPDAPGQDPAPPAAPEGAPDVGRRLFFRQFAGEIATTAATMVGAAQAIQRTSAELASTILDPDRLQDIPPTPAPPGAAAIAAADGTPVFRTAFRVEWPSIVFVDQRVLPRAVAEHSAATAAEVTWAIRNGIVVGGPAAGQAAAVGLALTAARVRATRPYARRATFRGAANALRNAAPANGSVANAVDRVMAAYDAIGELSEEGEAIAAAMRAEAETIIAESVADHGGLVEAGVALLERLPRPDGGPLQVLVHGPGGTLAGGQFGTVLTIAMTAHQRDLPIRVIVPEGRPRFFGSRISCWELAAAGVPYLLVADAAAPSLIAAGEVDVVLVPADRVARNGDVAAAIGTYPIAAIAAGQGVPVIACVAASAVTPGVPDGVGIDVGYLDAEALDRVDKTILAPPGTETRVPTHDITPAALVTTWLTARGEQAPPFGPPPEPDAADESLDAADQGPVGEATESAAEDPA